MVDLATEQVPSCFICAVEGTVLHPDLRDWVFGAPGTWRMKECRRCGVAWLSPRPTRLDIGKAYATYYTHDTPEDATILRTVVPLATAIGRSRQRVVSWFGQVAEHIRARRLSYPPPGSSVGVRLLSRLAERVPVLRDGAILAVATLPPGKGQRLLDVGCGAGEFLQRMRTNGWDAVGVEPDPVAAARARSKDLDVRDGLLEDAAFEANTFDAIVLSHVIEHVHDPMALLHECNRVLRPGGILVVMTPNLESVGHRRFGADWRGLEPPRHLHLFSSRALSTCIRKVGLTVADVRTSARWVRGIWWVSRVIQHRSGSRRRAPAVGSYLESWAMSLVEDALRLSNKLSSEEIILNASKPSNAVTLP
jgi:2-polyprenyl-3-methyl-5-hydroxy-6-metoxy-1,4-benzoquinol methylase